MKERLRGYFRLSSQSCDSRPEAGGNQRSSEGSITQDATTETCDDRAISVGDAAFNFNKSTKATIDQTRSSAIRKPFQGTAKAKCGVTRSTEVRPNLHPASLQRLTVEGHMDNQGQLNNSLSNITASTYCNGVDPSSLIEKAVTTPDRDRFHDNPISDSVRAKKERRASRSALYNHPLRTSQDSDLDSILSRRESSSTYERDMDIIDLLQRERSMEMPEALERERRIAMDPKGLSVSRQNSGHDRHHRRLPDLRRLAGTPSNPRRSSDLHFPNQVFTHQPHDVMVPATVLPSGRGVSVVAAAVAAQSSRSISNVPYTSLAKRDSVSSMLGTGSNHRLVDVDPMHSKPLVKRSDYREPSLIGIGHRIDEMEPVQPQPLAKRSEYREHHSSTGSSHRLVDMDPIHPQPLVKRTEYRDHMLSGSSHRLVELDPTIHQQPSLIRRSEYREQRLSSNHSGHSATSTRSGSLKGNQRNSRSSGSDFPDSVFPPNL